MVVTLPCGVAVPHDCDHQKIEGGSGVVDCVANNHAEGFGDVLSDLKLPETFSGINVILGADFVRLTINERVDLRVKIVDVMYGPVDL